MDPWQFQRWAFETKVGNPVRKAVLSMLSMMADCTTGRCEAKQETLAQGCEVTERAVRGHLKALAEAGIIARRPQYRRGGGRRGDEYLLLAPWVTEWPDGERPERTSGLPESPDASFQAARNEASGRARNDGSGQELPPVERPPQNDHASKQEQSARTKIPDDFPAELRPHANVVIKLLREIAADHNAKDPSPLALARAMMRQPRKPFVKTAYDLSSWAADPPRPIKDVVGTYRTFLDRAHDLAATERLDDDGHPTSSGTGTGGVARRPRDGGMTAREMHERAEAIRRGER